MQPPEGVLEVHVEHDIDEDYATTLIDSTLAFAQRHTGSQVHIVGISEALPTLAQALCMRDDITDNVQLVEQGHEEGEHRIVLSADMICDVATQDVAAQPVNA